MTGGTPPPAGHPGTPPPIVAERLELVSLMPELIDALLAGDAAAVGYVAPAGWPDEHDARFLRLRRGQMETDPGVPLWVRAIVRRGEPADGGRRSLLGHAGFHGPPGVNGGSVPDALELGYTVFPEFRGQGLAWEAGAALIVWARREHGVRHFFGSVAPGNAPSIQVLLGLGFAHVGEQWDDEDGRELVYELWVG